MNRNRWITLAIATILAFCISLSAVGCLVSGFDLPLESFPALVLTCAASALFCAAAFSLKRGGLLVLLVTALLGYSLWRRGEALEQLLQLIYRLSCLYDKAYGWGYLPLTQAPWDSGVFDLPLSILGALLALVVACSVCRRRSAFYVFLCALPPLILTLIVTDTVPGEGYLFSLFAGLILLLLTSRVRREDPAQANRLTLFAALPTLLALLILFLALPQEGYVNQSAEIRDRFLTWLEALPQQMQTTAADTAIQIQTQEPDTVNLAALGRRIESTVPVMEVTSDVGGTLYLRGQDYDVYDGTGWASSPHRVEDFSYQGADLGYVTIQTRSQLEQLYLPYYPWDAASLIGGKVDNTRLATQYTFARTSFDEPVHTLISREAYLASVNGTTYQPQEAYLSLPEATRAEAQTLVSQILQEEDTATEKAEAIAAYVRSSAAYDLDPGRMPSDAPDFALWFLETCDRGYCVHFATATTVLLRAAGIEARYVSGYMARLQAGETGTITGENAHAWAEYYEPLLGVWLVLESTPADLDDYVPAPPTETSAAQPETHATSATETTVPVTEPAPSAPTLSTISDTKISKNSPSSNLTGLVSALQKILLILSLFALLEAQRRLRIRLRRARQRRGTPNAQTLARWQETELLARLLKEEPPENLEFLAQKAKFSQHTLTPEDLLAFEAHLRATRKRLRQSPWYRQPLYQYLFALY